MRVGHHDGVGTPAVDDLKSVANSEYTVGWICAMVTEYVAARCFLDEEHDRPNHVSQHDTNDCTLGRIGKHNVVIAVLPGGGSTVQLLQQLSGEICYTASPTSESVLWLELPAARQA